MKGYALLDKLADLLTGGKEKQAAELSRRVWLQNFGLVTATSTVLWACGDDDDDKAVAAKIESPSGDAAIIKAAIELEN